MKTSHIKVPLRDGVMGAYLAVPDRTPVGGIVAIMEIWGVNDTMRKHAHEFAEAGFVCLVPDLFWRQEPDVELSDRNPEDAKKAFDLYYDFDYDLGVRDMEDTVKYLASLPECNGKAGAVGYLSKRSAAEELIQAIHQVANGKTFLDSKLAQAMAVQQLTGEQNPVEVLSDREFEVFMLLAKGQSVAQIAEKLFLSPRTVGTHLYNIKQKLNAGNSAEITLIAMRNGLLDH